MERQTECDARIESFRRPCDYGKRSFGILGTLERDDGTLLTCPSLAIVHAIGLILVIGYPITYYFHLRKFDRHVHPIGGRRDRGPSANSVLRPPQEQRSLNVWLAKKHRWEPA